MKYDWLEIQSIHVLEQNKLHRILWEILFIYSKHVSMYHKFILQTVNVHTCVSSGDDTTERIISLLKQHGDIIDQKVSILNFDSFNLRNLN